MESIVKKYVDAILIFKEVASEFKGQNVVHFFEAVAEEMRRRGIGEDDISNALKGAFWGQENWPELQQKIKASPSILDVEELKGGQTGFIEGKSR